LLRKSLLTTSHPFLLALLWLIGSGCGTIYRAETRSIARIFSEPPGSTVFVEDDDPALIRDALPFALKTYEALLASDPSNQTLCLATAEAFVTYAHGFIHDQAERTEATDFHRAQHLLKRSTKLYLRGRNYAFLGLDFDHPGFEARLRNDLEGTLDDLSQKDVPFVYWGAAGWAGAISADRSNMSLVAELPVAEAMMRRALELDESFGAGAIHEFFITYEGSRSDTVGGSAEQAHEHFERVVSLTGGRKASPYVLLASSVAVRQQDYRMFEDLLGKALAIDPDAVPGWRLSNLLAQEKARWLLDHSAAFFIDYKGTEQ
jgi:predicted anti-sigma-YlaC factor YlaD